MDIVLSQRKITIGLIIFSKNESKSIGPLIDRAKKIVSEQNIFVVDGHSIDQTEAVVKQRRVQWLLDSGKGKGDAIRTALASVERDLLIFMDADGSHQPEEIPGMLDEILEKGETAMVIGSRFKGSSEEFSGSPDEIMRWIGNKLGTWIVNMIWGARLTDIQNGFRIVRRNIFLELGLKENSFAIEQEMVMKCLKNKKKIKETASHELKRRQGKSHITPNNMLPRYIMSFIENIF